MLWAFAALGACRPPLPPSAPPADPTVASGGPIIVLGDTQRTLGLEAFFCGREQNELERLALIEKIAREERPAFVVHLGDMVTVGASDEEWQYFDRLISPLTVRRVPILPVLGNHDLWGGRRAAVRRARQRFPELANGGSYARRHLGLGLVWLNSNLEGALGRRQAAWFEAVLDVFERDPGVRGVLVFTHHPVYTNGKKRHGEPYVVSELLPPFLLAKKAVVWLSGHVHGYERFRVGERTFVVSGGAGGPRVDYAVGSDAVPAPAYAPATSEPRAFNYVVIDDAGSSLLFTVKCLKNAATCPDGVLERFSVNLPTRP